MWSDAVDVGDASSIHRSSELGERVSLTRPCSPLGLVVAEQLPVGASHQESALGLLSVNECIPLGRSLGSEV